MYKYSKAPFEGWLYRAKFEFVLKNEFHNSESHSSNIDVYTDDSMRVSVETEIKKLISEKVNDVRLVHFTTKEQDERDSIFIEETLRGI